MVVLLMCWLGEGQTPVPWTNYQWMGRGLHCIYALSGGVTSAWGVVMYMGRAL